MIVRVSSIAIVVYYQDSTSNHNASGISASDTKVVYYQDSKEVVYYQDSTSNHNAKEKTMIAPAVVYYQDSTSNHNSQCLHLAIR